MTDKMLRYLMETYDSVNSGSGGGGEAVLVNKTVSANGTYLPAADSADGYKKVVVNVPIPTPALTTKTITENGTYAAEDDNADGYSSVTVNVSGGGGGGINNMYGAYKISSAGALAIDGELKLYNYAPGSALYDAATYAGAGNKTHNLDLAGAYMSVEASGFSTGVSAGALEKITAKDDPSFYLLLISLSQVFRGQTHLVEVTARVLIKDGITSADRTFLSCSALEYINFAPNQCNASLALESSARLSDAGLVAIANCLIANNTGQTLTLHTTPKARCTAIMGTVTQVTDDTGTYDFFTADPNGTVTLAEFVTNTKGWTLA